MRHRSASVPVLRNVSDDEDVACSCQGECAQEPVISEEVLPPIRPRSVRMKALDRQGLVEMAYGRGGAQLLQAALQWHAWRPVKGDAEPEAEAG
jgi:hypothetical protein